METLMRNKSCAAQWVRLPSRQPQQLSTPIQETAVFSAKMKLDISTLSTV